MAQLRSSIALNTIVRQAKNQASTSRGDGIALLNLDTGHYVGLNESGAEIWYLIQKKQSVSDLCARLVERYNVPPDQCFKELVDVLTQLVTEGAVQIAEYE